MAFIKKKEELIIWILQLTKVVIIFKVLWPAMILLHADDMIHFTSKRSERNSQIN